MPAAAPGPTVSTPGAGMAAAAEGGVVSTGAICGSGEWRGGCRQALSCAAGRPGRSSDGAAARRRPCRACRQAGRRASSSGGLFRQAGSSGCTLLECTHRGAVHKDVAEHQVLGRGQRDVPAFVVGGSGASSSRFNLLARPALRGTPCHRLGPPDPVQPTAAGSPPGRRALDLHRRVGRQVDVLWRGGRGGRVGERVGGRFPGSLAEWQGGRCRAQAAAQLWTPGTICGRPPPRPAHPHPQADRRAVAHHGADGVVHAVVGGQVAHKQEGALHALPRLQADLGHGGGGLRSRGGGAGAGGERGRGGGIRREARGHRRALPVSSPSRLFPLFGAC